MKGIENLRNLLEKITQSQIVDNKIDVANLFKKLIAQIKISQNQHYTPNGPTLPDLIGSPNQNGTY